MVQYSISVSFRKKLSYQSINLKKTPYRSQTFLFKKNEKGCINSTSYKNIENHSMCNESKTEISLRLNDMALK